MRINQWIANVFLTSRLRQLLVAILSVTFGISMYVFMNSFMAGVNNTQTEITFTSMPHIKIYNDLSGELKPILPIPKDSHTTLVVNNIKNIRYTEGVRNADEIISRVAKLDEVTSITAQLNQNVFIRNGVVRKNATLSGIQTLSEDQVFHSSDYLLEGNLFDLDKQSNGIILGLGLAQNLGVGAGDNVSLMTSTGLTKTFKVIGLIETGAKGADQTRALVAMKTARQLFSKNRSYATEVLLNVKDYYKAELVAAELRKYTSYKVEAWQEGNSQLDSANVLRDIIAIAVSLSILLVAGFGIYNIMNMTVNEKIKEIAILKAMGFNGGDVIEIFLTQSVVIGFLGGIVGLGFGNIIVRMVDRVPFNIATLTTLPVEYRVYDYVMAFCFGVIITFLAGYLPARKASKLDPVEILRG